MPLYLHDGRFVDDCCDLRLVLLFMTAWNVTQHFCLSPYLADGTDDMDGTHIANHSLVAWRFCGSSDIFLKPLTYLPAYTFSSRPGFLFTYR